MPGTVSFRFLNVRHLSKYHLVTPSGYLRSFLLRMPNRLPSQPQVMMLDVEDLETEPYVSWRSHHETDKNILKVQTGAWHLLINYRFCTMLVLDIKLCMTLVCVSNHFIAKIAQTLDRSKKKLRIGPRRNVHSIICYLQPKLTYKSMWMMMTMSLLTQPHPLLCATNLAPNLYQHFTRNPRVLER